ncbi:hypothetical protein [Argonema antarcticum]|uniref:hypothetical protein n=1 Tax=Argonema antarcticum TaxID=2942763 RepID=UPI002010F841|nr:hypothetical protein [Argonema antarcticum]MCL1475836.1 hypothetical protein [Argonema antarcticum A004/B2]
MQSLILNDDVTTRRKAEIITAYVNPDLKAFGFQGIRVQIDVGSFRTWEGLEVGEFELLPISS